MPGGHGEVKTGRGGGTGNMRMTQDVARKGSERDVMRRRCK